MPIKIGPAGIGPVKDVEETFAKYKKLGIKTAEIPFTYGVFIKKKEDAEKVRKAAEKNGIELSIHAPYWINLNSAEKEKIEASKKRILSCMEIGTLLDVKNVVIHAGYYMGMDREITYENIKKQVLDLLETMKKEKYAPSLCVETMGKINVFGSLEEVAKLVEETRCGFCIDFAHVLARYKEPKFEEIKKLFEKHKSWHCHFSGIVYGEKGEKHHRQTERAEWKNLLGNLKNIAKGKNITIISEAPGPVEDAKIALAVKKVL